MKSWSITLLGIALLGTSLALSVPQNAQHPFNPQREGGENAFPILPKETAEYFDHLRRRYGIKGLSIALVASPTHTGEGWVNQTISLGEADVHGHKVTDQTLFAIASNSKLFTSVATQILVANRTILPNGKVMTLKTKIKDILGDEWVLKDKYAEERLDLIDLLSMRSGLPSHDYSIDDVPPSEVVKSLRYLEPSADAHQVWQYSNLHYLTLAHIVSTLSGLPFHEYVTQHIFDPLEMDHTMYNFTHARQMAGEGGMVDSFIRVGRNVTRCGEIWRLTDGWPIDGDTLETACIGDTVGVGWWSESDGLNNAGPWGIVTCGRDMVKWVKEMIDPNPKLVKRSLDMYAVPLGHNEANEFGVATYGLGQWSYTYRGHQVYGHTGGLPGASSLLYTLPQAGIGLMIAVNDVTFAKEVYDMIAYRVVDELLGETSIIDWEGRFMKDEFGSLKAIGSRPPTHPRPAEDISGVYNHPGHGTFTLDPIAINQQDAGIPDAVVEALAMSDFKLNTSSVWLSHWDKPFANYVAFSHFDGPLFNWTILGVYNRSGETDHRREVAVVHNAGPAVVTPLGMGMFGNWYDAGPTVDLRPVVEEENTVKEAAEVWFSRLL